MSVKLKILAIVLSSFTVIAVAFTLYLQATTANYRQLRTDDIAKIVAYESERVGKIIAEMERNAVDLALAGRQFFQTSGRTDELGRSISVENFSAFKAAVGGGIWFEPYALSAGVRRVCYYAFFDPLLNAVRYDPDFETEEYDYHTQMWYTTIAAGLGGKGKYDTVWTAPYYDDSGTNSLMTTVGAGIYDGSGHFVGMSTVDWQIQSMVDRLSAIKPTENSFVLLASPKDDYILSATHEGGAELTGASLRNLPWYGDQRFTDGGAVNIGRFIESGVEYLSFSRLFDNGWLFSVQIPALEIFAEIEMRNNQFTVIIAVSFLSLLALVAYLLSLLINRPLRTLTSGVAELGSGNFDKQITISSRDEFGALAVAFNKMTVDLKVSIDQIAQERKAQENAELARVAAERANMAKSEFLARMSHEIRTPMNAVIGMSELAQRDYYTPKSLEYISGIKNAGLSLLSIINDILDFSKIESGRLELDASPYNTASLLHDVLTIIRVRMAEKPLKLVVDTDPDIPCNMIGDAGRVRQVLLNLLSNAVKYTKKGFIKLSISGEPAAENTIRLTLIVEDSGIGIKKDDMPRLFSDFSRIDEKRNSAIEGTGLGLSITRSLCLAMGGEITAKSEYGKGSVFTATIIQIVGDWKPMGDMSAAAMTPAGTQSVTFTAPEAEVLVVDDFSSNLLVAEGLLSPYAMCVVTCQNGREAVELVQARSFDLVLMDHMMPEMDGVEAVAYIRALGGRFTELPIAALTANIVSGMKELFLASGFNDFISKPINTAALDALLRKWIPKGKQRKPREEAFAIKGQDRDAGIKIAGVDTEHGIAMSGGAVDMYLRTLAIYREDGRRKIQELEACLEKGDLPMYTTHVQALKSATANIGAVDLTKLAEVLEMAGQLMDMDSVQARNAHFVSDLAILLDAIDEVVSTHPG